MGRKRIELSSARQAEITARAQRGESLETIAAALGGAVSRSTIDRRLRELKTGTSPRRPGTPMRIPVPVPIPKPASAESEALPEAVPDGTPLEQIEGWMRRIEAAADKAEQQGNLAAFASLMTRLRAFEDARRKATPIPKSDPNDDPDMLAMGEQAERRLMQLIDDALTPPGAR